MLALSEKDKEEKLTKDDTKDIWQQMSLQLIKNIEDLDKAKTDSFTTRSGKVIRRHEIIDMLLNIFSLMCKEFPKDIPENVSKYIGESIASGKIKQTASKPRGLSNKEYECIMTCLDIFKLIIEEEILKDNAITLYASKNNIEESAIYKRLENYGDIAMATTPMMWSRPLTLKEQQLIKKEMKRKIGTRGEEIENE